MPKFSLIEAGLDFEARRVPDVTAPALGSPTLRGRGCRKRGQFPRAQEGMGGTRRPACVPALSLLVLPVCGPAARGVLR